MQDSQQVSAESLECGTPKTEKAQDRLARLGFNRASRSVAMLAEKKKKLAIAYEHYRYVRMEKMNAFKKKLREDSYKNLSSGRNQWKELSFTPLDQYNAAPPSHVLDSLETAIGRNCFDAFAIAHIVKVEDPILFGYVNGCTDHFFIDQWDNDVKISDILKDNEG